MAKQETVSEELAAIREEIRQMRQERIYAWQLASHIIGRQQVMALSDRGLSVVYTDELEELHAK